VEPRTRRALADVDVEEVDAVQHVVGHEGVLDAHAVRAAAPQAEQVAPVVELLELVAAQHQEELASGELVELDLAVAVGLHHGARHEVGRPRDPGAVVPGPVDEIAALDLPRGPAGSVTRRRPEFAVGTEHLALRLLLEERRGLQAVRRGQRQAPARRRTSSGDLDDHVEERRDVELVAAEHLRLQDPVEAGRVERRVHLRGVEGPLLGGLLALQQRRAHARGPSDHHLRSQGGLGRFDVGYPARRYL